MKFSLISDLHIDFPQPRISYEQLEDVVVVAGDTSNGLEGLKFLNKLRRKGFEVFACDGNHEHYRNLSQGRTCTETTLRFITDFPATGAFSQTSYRDIPIVIANGWYPVTNEVMWQNYMNDSRNCDITATDANVMACNDATFVEDVLKGWKAEGRKGVIVTHTAPCEETLDSRFAGHFSNEWYWNPGMRPLLSKYKDQIHVWCHGHTHARNEAVVDEVRVVCNPRGYPGENPDWAPLTIEI